MIRKLFLAAMFGSSLCASVGRAAAPSLYAANGHSYEAVLTPNGITWAAANTAAQAASFNGQAGNLATLTSGGENTFAFNLINNVAFWQVVGSDSRGPWLGGLQPAGSSEPAGGWSWVT